MNELIGPGLPTGEGTGATIGRPTLTAAVCRDVPDATLYRMSGMGGLAAILGAIGELRAATARRDGKACEEWLVRLLAFGEDQGNA